MLPWAVKNISVFSEALVDACSRLEHAAQRERVAAQQRQAVLAMTGDFGGAEQIAADLAAQATSAGLTKRDGPHVRRCINWS